MELIEKFQGSEVFLVRLKDEPLKFRDWVRLSEVSKVLDFANGKEYVETHCKEWQYRQFKVGTGRPALYVCISGLVRLCLKSKSPIAIDFQDWITEELIPKLWTEGGYILPTATKEQLEALENQCKKQGEVITQLSQELGQALYEATGLREHVAAEPQRIKTAIATRDLELEEDIGEDPKVWVEAMRAELNQAREEREKFVSVAQALGKETERLQAEVEALKKLPPERKEMKKKRGMSSKDKKEYEQIKPAVLLHCDF